MNDNELMYLLEAGILRDCEPLNCHENFKPEHEWKVDKPTTDR